MTNMVLTLLLGALIGQTPPKSSDFSGVWVKDNAKSVSFAASEPREVELSVVDSGKTVKVVRNIKTSNPKVPGGWIGAETYTGTNDGKPSEYRIPDLQYSRFLTRQSRDLVWRITLTRISDGGSTKFTERWSVSEDGNTMTILRTYRDGREATEVFARKPKP